MIVSLDRACVDKLKSCVEKHCGNFSDALREIIEKAERNGFPANSIALDYSMFKWMLSEINGLMIPDSVMDEIINPRLINSIRRLEEYLNNRFKVLDWGTSVAIKCDNDSSPSEVFVEIKGDPQRIKFASRLISQFLVKNSPEQAKLRITSVTKLDKCIKVELSRSDKGEALKSLVTFFGKLDEILRAINRTRKQLFRSNYNIQNNKQTYA